MRSEIAIDSGYQSIRNYINNFKLFGSTEFQLKSNSSHRLHLSINNLTRLILTFEWLITFRILIYSLLNIYNHKLNGEADIRNKTWILQYIIFTLQVHVWKLVCTESSILTKKQQKLAKYELAFIFKYNM